MPIVCPVCRLPIAEQEAIAPLPTLPTHTALGDPSEFCAGSGQAAVVDSSALFDAASSFKCGPCGLVFIHKDPITALNAARAHLKLEHSA